MVGKREPLSEDPSRGWAACGTANGGSWKRSSGSPSRGWPHPWNPQRVLRGRGSPASVHHQRYLYLYLPTYPTHHLPRIRGRPRSRGLRMTRQHHKITTGSAVRRAPPRTRHEEEAHRESSDRQSPVSLRCRFLIVNGRTRGFPLGRWLATWEGGLLRRGRRAVRLGPAGAGREKARDPPTLFYFLFFFLTGKFERSVVASVCKSRCRRGTSWHGSQSTAASDSPVTSRQPPQREQAGQGSYRPR